MGQSLQKLCLDELLDMARRDFERKGTRSGSARLLHLGFELELIRGDDISVSNELRIRHVVLQDTPSCADRLGYVAGVRREHQPQSSRELSSDPTVKSLVINTTIAHRCCCI